MKTEVISGIAGKKYTLCTLDSGLKIYLYKMPGFTSYYGMFGTRYGSIDNAFVDQNGNTVELPEGIAHFLEHKLFESEDGDAFTKYSKTGAYSNAYTSFDRTCYLFSCSQRFYENLGILLDFVRSPYFTAETVAKEQGIIGQEIRMYDDQPTWQVLFNMLSAMFYSHPVKIDIAGTVESISKITHELLYKCYDKFYNLSNMFITLAGDFDEEEVLGFINKNLKTTPKSEVVPAAIKEPDEVVKPYVEVNLEVAKPLFCMGFKEKLSSDGVCIKDAIAMDVLLRMLVGSASSLYKTLLEKELINEEFAPEYFTGRNIAIPMFEGESKDPKMVKELILKELEKFKTQGLDPVLFEAVRKDMFGRMLRRFDSAESVCSMLADANVMGYEPFEYIENLKNLKIEQVADRLSVFDTEKCVLSVVRRGI
ncbi:MAG: insulinase family protein [Clostridia bacterium]|nr:insulinase family protein [Clostridia bacterium]